MAFIDKVVRAVRERVKVPAVFLPESLEDAEKMAALADEHVLRVIEGGNVAIVVFALSASIPLREAVTVIGRHANRMSEAGMLVVSSDSIGCGKDRVDFHKKVFELELDFPSAPHFVLFFECKSEWVMPEWGDVK